MISYIMKSLLLILALAIMNSQARTLTENCMFNSKAKEATGVVVTPSLESFIHRETKAPPPPKSATPVIEMIATGTLKSYARKGKIPPPAPTDASPTRPTIEQWGGAAGAILAQLASA